MYRVVLEYVNEEGENQTLLMGTAQYLKLATALYREAVNMLREHGWKCETDTYCTSVKRDKSKGHLYIESEEFERKEN